MRTILFTLLFGIQLSVSGQSKPDLAPAAMQEDFAYLRSYLEKTHPGLYKQTTEAVMQTKMDSLAATLHKPLPFLEFFKKIAYLIAEVRCEHSSAGYGEGFDTLMYSTGFLPLQLYFTSDRSYILLNRTADRDIKPGDELLSINGFPMDSIRKVLYLYIPADAHMTTSKDHQLSGMAFNVWYHLFIEQATKFALVVRTADGKIIKKTVKPVTFAKLNVNAVKNPVNKPVLDLDASVREWRKKPLHLELLPEKKAAVLSVLTFSVDILTFRQQLDSLYQLIAKNGTKRLIIDLRNNGGGEVELAADLLNYFITTPTSIVEYSYTITDKDEHLKLANIPDEIRQNKYDYIEPLKDGKSFARLTKYSGELKILQPRADRFTGKVYLYVNGGTASAASTFTAVMKSLGLATIVGQETAGGYAGGGTAFGLDLTLPNSKITTHTTLVYQRFRTTGGNPSRGVIPDVNYELSLKHLISNEKDVWHEFILGLN